MLLLLGFRNIPQFSGNNISETVNLELQTTRINLGRNNRISLKYIALKFF